MDLIFDLNPTLLAVLGGAVMGIIQAIKPFINTKYTLGFLGIFSVALGILLALHMAAGATLYDLALQSIVNAYFITIAAAGPYSIAKSVSKKENPAGL